MKHVLESAVAAVLLLSACDRKKQAEAPAAVLPSAPTAATPGTGGDYRDLSPEGVPVTMRVPWGMSVQGGEVMLPEGTSPARSVLLTKDAFQMRVIVAPGLTLEQQLSALTGVAPASSGATEDGWEIVVRHSEQHAGLWRWRRQPQILCEAPALAGNPALKDARKLCESATRAQ